jgi:hypothetical protein
MKKQNFSTLVKNSILLGFTSLLLIAGTTVSSAQTSTSPEPTVKYIGSLDGQPVFGVSLNNLNGGVYHFTIKDETGNILYAERVKGKAFSKKFKFENTDRQNVKLTFSLEGKEGVQSQEFQVNSSTRVFNDVVVTSL